MKQIVMLFLIGFVLISCGDQTKTKSKDSKNNNSAGNKESKYIEFIKGKSVTEIAEIWCDMKKELLEASPEKRVRIRKDLDAIENEIESLFETDSKEMLTLISLTSDCEDE